MSRRFLLLFALLLATGPKAAAGPDVLAYYISSGDSALRQRFGFFNQVATDVFIARPDGTIQGEVPIALLDFLQSKKITAYATVANFGSDDFQGSIVHAIISSNDASSSFLVNMKRKLSAGNYRGLNLDFESLAPKDRALFTAFVHKAAVQMHAAGYLLILSVPAEQADDPSNSWNGAFDLKALADAVDLFQVMAYDQHGSWGTPGPVAGLDWVEGAVRYTTSVIPPAKVNLGVPAYGFDWDLADKAKSTWVAWNQTAPLLAMSHEGDQWDQATSSAHFRYERDGHAHIVWHETARGLSAKAALAARYHLAGLSVWVLGDEDDSFWRALKSAP